MCCYAAQVPGIQSAFLLWALKSLSKEERSLPSRCSVSFTSIWPLMAFPPFKHDRRAAEPQHDNTGQTLPFRRMDSGYFHYRPIPVTRTWLSKRLWAALTTGSDSVLTGAALPVCWFFWTPLRMFTFSFSPSTSPTLYPAPFPGHVTLCRTLSCSSRPACQGLFWSTRCERW